MKSAELLVRCLQHERVEYVFGIPGEENLDLLDALADSSIRLVVTRHEQAAGFMAATYGRLTGRVGVCLATLGPGALNLVTPVAFAQLGGMPMLTITGQKPVKSSKQGQFQIVDIVDTMQPITKLTHSIVSGANIPARVREAIRLAEEERPGAVHLELPEDVAAEETDGEPMHRSLVRRPVAEAKAVRAAAERIEAATRPLAVIGAAANRKLTCHMLRKFFEQTGIPFVTTQMGKGVADDLNPRCLGNAALSSGDFVHRAIDAADLIINIGHDVIEKPPFVMQRHGTDVIHVNFFSAQVDPVYFPQIEVVGDIANSVWQLTERVARQPHWQFDFFDRVRTALQQHIADDAADARFPILPQRLVAEVRAATPEKGIVALDNGIYKIWFARNYPARFSNCLLLDNALATMGAGLPSAIAAKLVYPDRCVTAVCGDGGFMMNSQELETAIRLGLNLTVLVLRDDAYGMIKWKQQHMGLRDYGLDFGNPDFVRYAESYGAHGHRLAAAADLAPLLRRCHQTPGVHVIDAPVDYSDNDRVLNEEITRLSATLQPD
ncbi:MAG: acetolactate synthase large subunit [Planctomycetales bacterium]|nr:acetolactate synthase large subunit [Planctomycetales bacterium]